MRKALIWAALTGAVGLPLLLSLQSPYLAYRQPIYIIAGAAGVLAFGLLLVQPLLARCRLPLAPLTARRVHAATGAVLALLVAAHVAALWLPSPPDVLAALLLRSPTPFSLWGVIAMWAVCLAALLALMRRRLAHRIWRGLHRALAPVIAGGTIAHALLIEGTMEPLSKFALCAAVALATLIALTTPHPWRKRRK